MKEKTEPSVPYRLDKINEPEIIFREVQYFRQSKFWLLMILSSLLPFLLFLISIFYFPHSQQTLIFGFVMLLVTFFPPIFFLAASLTVEVRHDGLYIRFFPFHATFFKISPNEIKNWQIRIYSALKEYGGYGVRFGADGKAYNVRGNRGVQIVLKNGTRILVGSQKPEQLEQALEYLYQTAERKLIG